MSLFYIVSKIINVFLAPANWIIILLLIAFFVKRRSLKKGLHIAAVAVFILFSNKALFDVAVKAWQPVRIDLKDSANYSAGIVLGGMSQVDRNGHGYFTEASDRFIQAVQLYHRKVIRTIVITGATLQKDLPEEGTYLVPEFIKAGVRPEDIYAETKATNTFENAAYSKALLLSKNLQPPYVVITSAIHINRSKRVFDKAGVQAIMYPANYLAIDKDANASEIFFPNIKTLDDWRYLIKEWVGIIGYQLANKA